MNQLSFFDYHQFDSDTQDFLHQRTDEIKSLMRRSAQDIIEIGQKLIEVKERLGHGQFGTWLECEFAWTDRTARRFMQVAERFKSDKLSDLSFAPSALYLLAAPSTPRKAVQEAMERAEEGEEITHRTAQDIVNEHKDPEPPRKPENIPSPRELAMEWANRGDGYTEEEWAKCPDSYTGDCYKDCYGPRVMVKGEMYEYGVWGVYICTGCGYAYPPFSNPEPSDIIEHSDNGHDEEIQEVEWPKDEDRRAIAIQELWEEDQLELGSIRRGLWIDPFVASPDTIAEAIDYLIDYYYRKTGTIYARVLA